MHDMDRKTRRAGGGLEEFLQTRRPGTPKSAKWDFRKDPQHRGCISVCISVDIHGLDDYALYVNMNSPPRDRAHFPSLRLKVPSGLGSHALQNTLCRAQQLKKTPLDSDRNQIMQCREYKMGLRNCCL